MGTGARFEAADPRLEVRSFQAVFDLERRIYRVDRLRLNPAGVPVRGVVYFAALWAAVALAARVPVLGWPLARMPWFIRYLAAPGAAAAVLAIIRIDGRSFHKSVGPILRLATGPRTLSRLSPCPPLGTRWWPPDVVLIPDGSDPRVRNFRYRGPGAVLVLCEHERVGLLSTPRRRQRVGVRRGRAAVAAVRAVPNARALAAGRMVRVPRRSTLVVRGLPAPAVPARAGRGLARR